MRLPAPFTPIAAWSVLVLVSGRLGLRLPETLAPGVQGESKSKSRHLAKIGTKECG